MKQEIDISKYDPKNKDDKQNIHIVVKMIREGEVQVWSQLEIMSSLNGIEVDNMLFINLLKYITIKSVYDFMYKSINECEDCAKFFECYETIERILNKDGELICSQGGGFNFYPERFSCINFLRTFEIRHPIYFLKFFLKTEQNAHIGKHNEGYVKFLKFIISRTKLRATKNKDYDKLVSRLEELYYSYSNIERFVN